MRKTVLAAKKKSMEELKQELKTDIATHKKVIAKFKRANLHVVTDTEPEIGEGDSGTVVFSGEISVRGKSATYGINTPRLNSVAKWTKKGGWKFDDFKGTPDACIKYIIDALTSEGSVLKLDPELVAKEKGILNCIGDAAFANIKSGNVARITYRSKSQGGKILWIAVQAPRDMTDMEGQAIREADAKKAGVTLQQILDYLIAKDAKKPKKQKRSTGHFIYD
jgi:hypothetical protein